MAKIGYARVSSKEQNLNRQIEKLNAVGVQEIFEDKQSGKDTNRKGLQDLFNFIRKGDIVVVTELDRLGRNSQEITNMMTKIHQKEATLEVLSFPSLTGIEDENLRRMLNNLILELFKYTAENERKQIRERQRQGIELARKQGKYKGRPVSYSKDSTNKQKRVIYHQVVDMLEKEVAVLEIAKELGIARNTVYRIKNELSS